jgi:hypothetical protein
MAVPSVEFDDRENRRHVSVLSGWVDRGQELAARIITVVSRFLIVFVVLFVLGGCSFVFTHGPPADHPKRKVFDCSTSQAAPIIDAAIAGFQTFRVIYATTQDDSDYQDFPISRGADIGVGIGLTALFFVSSLYGYATISDCEEAKEALYERTRRPKAAPTTRPTPTAKKKRQCTNDMQCEGTAICVDGSCAPMPAPASSPVEVKRVGPAAPTEPEPEESEEDSTEVPEKAPDEIRDRPDENSTEDPPSRD